MKREGACSTTKSQGCYSGHNCRYSGGHPISSAQLTARAAPAGSSLPPDTLWLAQTLKTLSLSPIKQPSQELPPATKSTFVSTGPKRHRRRRLRSRRVRFILFCTTSSSSSPFPPPFSSLILRPRRLRFHNGSLPNVTISTHHHYLYHQIDSRTPDWFRASAVLLEATVARS